MYYQLSCILTLLCAFSVRRAVRGAWFVFTRLLWVAMFVNYNSQRQLHANYSIGDIDSEIINYNLVLFKSMTMLSLWITCLDILVLIVFWFLYFACAHLTCLFDCFTFLPAFFMYLCLAPGIIIRCVFWELLCMQPQKPIIHYINIVVFFFFNRTYFWKIFMPSSLFTKNYLTCAMF